MPSPPPKPTAPPAPPSSPSVTIPSGWGASAPGKGKKRTKRKKKTTKKAAKKKVTKKVSAARTSAPKPDASREEINPATLPEAEARKRVAAIYRLEKVVGSKRAVHDAAKRGAKSAKTALSEAEEALEQEINEQRFGPGPLFSPDGKGPAVPPKK